MLELLLVGVAVAVAALFIRRRHVRSISQAAIPFSYDRRVDPVEGADRFLERRVVAGSELRALVRPIGTPGRRGAAVAVGLDGVPVGYLTRGDAGRYRARNGDAVTTGRGQVIRPTPLGKHELWVELHL